MARGLHRVGVEQHPCLAADGADFFDGIDGADLIVGKHDRDKAGLRPDGRSDLLRVDLAFAVHRDEGDLKAFLLQPLCRVQQGVVLHRRGDEVVFAPGL